MEGAKITMLDKANSSPNSLSDPDSPSRLNGNMLSDVRGKLNKIKLSSADPNNVSFDGML
jgi:hypothetical protein